MKKKIIAIVAVFAMSLCGFSLAACTDNTGKYAVTFNANGGYFADTGTVIHYETVESGGYAKGEKEPTHTDATLTFSGWGESSNATTVIKLGTYKITKDTEFFAVWAKEDQPTPQHTVTFYNNYTGASTSVFTTKAVDDGTAVAAPSPAPSRGDAYNFDGWYTQAEGGSLYNFATKVTANLSLYAHWSEKSPEEANLTGIQITQNPTKTKYVAGEALDLTGLKVTASYSDGSSKEITGYTTNPAAGAKLTETNTSVTVSYSGKTASFNITVVARKVEKLEIGGELVNKTQKVGALLDVTGLTFTAKYNDGTEVVLDSSDITFTSAGFLTEGRFTAPGETVTITASYGGRAPTFTLKVEEPTTPQHDVTFDGNKPAGAGEIKGVPNTKTVEEGETVSKPATDPTLLGYTFGGWYKEAACTTEWKFSGENADVMGTDDVTLYAKWTAKTYTIDYKLGGDTTDPVNNGANPETYTAGGSDITLADPTREHYDFDGWYIIKTGDEEDVKVTKIDYSSITATGISVTAKWTAKTYDLTLELEYEDESTAPYTVNWIKTKPTSYTYGTAKELPDSSYIEVTTKDSESAPYEFLGWYVKGDTTKTTVSTIAKGSSENKTYVAKIEIATTYLFTYNCGYDHHGDGSTTSTVKIVEGEKAENRDLSELNRKGYTFGGWYNTADCTDGDEYDFDTAVTEAKTVYAKWTAIAYTVAYEGDGITVEFPTTYHITDEDIDLTDSTKITLDDGYYLDGWYYLDKTDKKVTVTAVGAALIDFADSENTITLYAKSSNKYTVVYNANKPEGATGAVDNLPEDDEIEYDATITEPTITPDMTDYGFIGWYTDAACTTAWDFDTDVVDSSVGISSTNRTFTLYAKWYTKPTNGKYILGSISGYETWSDVLLGADASSYKATVIRYATEGGKQVAKEWRVSGLTLKAGDEFRFVDYTKSGGIAGLVWNEPYQNANTNTSVKYYVRPEVDPAIMTIGTTVADHPNYVVKTYAGGENNKWTIEFGTNDEGKTYLTITQEGFIGWRDPKNAGNKPTAAEALEEGVWYLTGNFTDWFKQTEAWSTIGAIKDETNSYFIEKVYLKNNDTFKIMCKVNENTQYWLGGKYEALSKSITLTTAYSDNIILSGIEDGFYNIVFTDRHTGNNAADIRTVVSYLTIMKYVEPDIEVNPADPIYETDEISQDNLIVTAGGKTLESSEYVFIGYEYGESDGKLTATVTIRYQGAYFTETLDVIPLEVKSIAVKTNTPTQLLYYVGDALDTAGLKIIVTYNNGTTKEVSGDELDEMFDITANLVGRTTGNLFNGNTVTVSIVLKNSEPEIKTSYDVTVYNKVTSIVATLPEGKDEYFVDDLLDISGMTITAYFNGSETLSAPVTANYTTDLANGTKLTLLHDKVVVSFTRTVDDLGSRTVTCDIPLTVKEPQITAITVTGSLNNKNYTVGDTGFNPSGLKFNATYDNGKNGAIDASILTLSLGDCVDENGMFIKAGTVTVTVSYGEIPVTVDPTADLTFTVSDKLTSIVVDASGIVKPHEAGFVDGDALTATALDGIVVKAMYNEDVEGATVVDVVLSRGTNGYTVSPAIGTELHEGDTTITVTHRTKTATFTITAVALEVISLTVEGEPVVQYAGSAFNATDLTFKANFNNDKFEVVQPADIKFTSPVINGQGNFISVAQEKNTVTATYTDEDGNKFTCDIEVSVNNTTKYLIQFNVNIPGTGKVASGMPANQNVTHYDSVEEPTIVPTLKGYTFDGWYKEAACENEFDFDEPIIDNGTIYAKWNSKTYTIIYSVDGSTAVLTNGEYKATANLFPELTLTTPAEKTGHEFVGWCFNSDLSDETPIKRMTYARIPADADATDTIKLYAKYELKEYSVTFDLRGGVETYEEQTVKHGQTVTDPGTPTRKHWDFAFWYVGEKEQTNPTAFALTTPITEDTVIYARWTGINYTVQYNLDGGTNGAGNPDTFSFPDPDVTLAPATKEGHTFAGWKYNGKIVDKITNDMLPNDRDDVIELTATYTAIVYRTVTFYYNDGTTENKTVSVENGKTVAKPANPTRDGWTFNGWYDNDEFTGDAYDFTNTAVTANLGLHAKWTRNTVKVTFNYNYGTTPIVKEETIYQNETAESVKPTPNPTRSGYQFMGWFRKTGETLASTAYDFSTQVTTALTLYAKWEKITGGNVIIGANDKHPMYDNSEESDYALEYKLIMETQITAGATVKFEVDGVVQQVYINEYSHGVTYAAGLHSSITITDTGTYSFYLQKSTVNDANWTIYLSYAEYVQNDGYYLVGDFNGNSSYKWATVNPAFALKGNKILNVGLKADNKIKLAKASGTAIDWDSNLGYDALTEDCKKLKYIGVDNDRNIVIKYDGTFNISVADGKIVISSDDVVVPELPDDGLYIGTELIQEFAPHQGSEVKLIAVQIPKGSKISFIYGGATVTPTIKSDCPDKSRFTNWVCAAGGIFDMYYDFGSKQIWIEYKGTYTPPAEDLGGLAVDGTITHAFVVNAGGANEVWTGATQITLAAETQFTVQYGGAAVTGFTLKTGSLGEIKSGKLVVPCGKFIITYNYADNWVYVSGTIELPGTDKITADANSIVIKYSDGWVKITLKNTAGVSNPFLHIWGSNGDHTGGWEKGTLGKTFEVEGSITIAKTLIVGHGSGQSQNFTLPAFKHGDHLTIELTGNGKGACTLVSQVSLLD